MLPPGNDAAGNARVDSNCVCSEWCRSRYPRLNNKAQNRSLIPSAEFSLRVFSAFHLRFGCCGSNIAHISLKQYRNGNMLLIRNAILSPGPSIYRSFTASQSQALLIFNFNGSI